MTAAISICVGIYLLGWVLGWISFGHDPFAKTVYPTPRRCKILAIWPVYIVVDLIVAIACVMYYAGTFLCAAVLCGIEWCLAKAGIKSSKYISL